MKDVEANKDVSEVLVAVARDILGNVLTTERVVEFAVRVDGSAATGLEDINEVDNDVVLDISRRH